MVASGFTTSSNVSMNCQWMAHNRHNYFRGIYNYTHVVVEVIKSESLVAQSQKIRLQLVDHLSKPDTHSHSHEKKCGVEKLS